MNILPESSVGKWSMKLIIFSLVLFIMALVIVKTQGSNGPTAIGNPRLFVTMLLAGFCAIASFFAGIVDIIRNKERSPLILLSTLIGFLVLLFALGEVVIPH